MRFQKFEFSFHWKRIESISFTPPFSYRFTRPHEKLTMKTTENDFKLLLAMCKRTTQSLSIFSIFSFWNNVNGLGLWSHDQSFSKVCVFKSFHSGDRFQNLIAFSSFSCGQDMKMPQNVCVLSTVWTGALVDSQNIKIPIYLHWTKYLLYGFKHLLYV